MNTRITFYVCPHCGTEVNMDNKKQSLEWKGKIKLDAKESLQAKVTGSGSSVWSWNPIMVVNFYLGKISGEYEVRLVHNHCSKALIEDRGPIKDILKDDNCQRFFGSETYSRDVLRFVIESICKDPTEILKKIKVEWDLLSDKPIYVSTSLKDVPEWKLRRIAARKARKVAELMAGKM